MEREVEDVKMFYKDLSMVGKHYLLRHEKYPNVKR